MLGKNRNLSNIPWPTLEKWWPLYSLYLTHTSSIDPTLLRTAADENLTNSARVNNLDVRSAAGLHSVQIPDHDGRVDCRAGGHQIAVRMHSQRVARRRVKVQRMYLTPPGIDITSVRQQLQQVTYFILCLLASCLIYARALVEYVTFIVWVRSVNKMLPCMKFAKDKVLTFLIPRKNAKVVQFWV